MKTIAFAAAIAAAAITVTAAAGPAVAQTPAKGSFQGAKVSYKVETNEYCFKGLDANAVIQRTDCRSKEEWAENGLQISHKRTVEFARR